MDGGNVSCKYGLESLDLRPPIECFNQTLCEISWPCELREYWDQIHPLVDLTQIFLSYGTMFICILGILLNGLSFYVLLSSGLARNGSGLYLVTLSICDTGNLIFNYALGVARGESEEFNSYFQANEWLCRFHGVFVEIFQLISAWIVVCFTIERCLAVWYPILLRASSQSRSRFVISLTSVILSLFSLSKLFLVGFEKDSVFGYVACASSRHFWEGMSYMRVAFQTWIPTVLVALFNCLMFWKLRRVKSNRKRLTAYRGTSSEEWSRQSIQSNRRHRSNSTTPMLIAVSLAYLTLVLPLGAVQTVELHWNMHYSVVPSSEEPQRTAYIHWMRVKLLLKCIRSFCFAFYQINFAINFFLYCAAGVQFRTCLGLKLRNLSSMVSGKLHFCRGREVVRTNTKVGGTNSTKTVTSEMDSAI